MAKMQSLNRGAAEPDEGGGNGYRAPAVEKALEVLEFMAKADTEGLTQSEIASGVGRSFHEIYRILRVLIDRGYLVRDHATGRIGLSSKLFELAHYHPPLRKLTEAALPAMKELARSICQSCHLGVLRGEEVVVVLQVDSPLPMKYSVELGSRFPALETSSGRVLLAFLDSTLRGPLFTRMPAQMARYGGLAAIATDLQRIAKEGRDVRSSLVIPAITNISFPIRDHLGQVVAALTVPFLDQNGVVQSLERAITATAEAAAAISGSSIGHGEPWTESHALVVSRGRTSQRG